MTSCASSLFAFFRLHPLYLVTLVHRVTISTRTFTSNTQSVVTEATSYYISLQYVDVNSREVVTSNPLWGEEITNFIEITRCKRQKLKLVIPNFDIISTVDEGKGQPNPTRDQN